ncbi:MAG: hypothetical protein U0996_03800 [Planctomycetaceae bacterium]
MSQNSQPFPAGSSQKAAASAFTCCPILGSLGVRIAMLAVGLLFFQQACYGQVSGKVRIVETIWGFDGRTMKGEFQPLSILLDNLSDQTIDGTVELRCNTGLVRRVGGVMQQPLFLGPNSRRWVQFYPYIFGQMVSWDLELQTETETIKFDPIDQSRLIADTQSEEEKEYTYRATVILDPVGMLQRSPTTIKHLPSEIFPPYSTATHGLHAVFLDHVPDWDEPRQAALLGWLQTGGQLHLLLDQNRQTLRFSGILAALNEPFPEFSVEAGTVIRHDYQRGDLTRETVTSISRIRKKPVITNEDSQKAFSTGGSGLSWEDLILNDDDLYHSLRKLTEPDHAWAIILLLSLCYVGLLFPGAWIFSQKRRKNYLAPYGAILAVVVVFSGLFLFVGQRGYNEESSIRTLAIAMGQDKTHWSCLDFTHVFVTSGGEYHVSSKNQQALIASGSSDEATDSTTTQGDTATFESLMPPFSSQPVISRRRIETPDWGIRVKSFSATANDLTELQLSCSDKFPTKDVLCYAIYGSRVYAVAFNAADRTLVMLRQQQAVQSFVSTSNNDEDYTVPAYQRPTRIVDPKLKFRDESLRRLLQRSLTSTGVVDLKAWSLPPGKIRFLVFMPMPRELMLDSDISGEPLGDILFVRDLPMTSEQ